MRPSPPLLLLAFVLAAPAARAEGLSVLSDLNAALSNRMVGFFIGYGAATGAYNGSPL